jgi:YD repeat-containing protein
MGAIAIGLALASPVAAQNNPFSSDGAPSARGTYGSFPFEQVDPLSGNLLMAVTDLSLPGPIPLTVSRSYNSKFHKDFEHNDQSVGEWSPLGVGWRMHFGRVLHAESTTAGDTVIEGTDGGGGPLYQTSAYPEGWITKGFVRYNRNTNQALFPDGLVYTFGHVGASNIAGPFGIVRYVTEIRDQFNNTITFSYEGMPGLVTRARQTLSASQVRDVFFVYNSNGTLTNIQYGNRVWTFQHDPAPGWPGHTLLRKVLPPAGLAWEHQYGGLAGLELTSLIAPGSGRVDYTYATVQRRANSLNQSSRVVSVRAVGGRAVTPGTWNFSYSTGTNLDTTVIACPCGTTSYRYNGIGISGNFSAWAQGTLAERQVRDPATGAVLEQETFTYGASAAISPSVVTGESGQWGDPAVYNALTTQRVLTRSSGGTWTTTLEYNPTNYNDFGRPFRITEQGDLTRITEVAFQYGFTPWIVGGVSSSAFRVVPGSLVQTGSTTYDAATGFVTSTTIMGVTTTFTPNANGTVAAATNANGHTTQYRYDWGVRSETRNPVLWTLRGINEDGTVASEQVGNDPNAANNLLTTYGYDELGRLRWVQPRNANIVRYAYEDVQGNLYVKVDRGASQAWTHLDGFGRAIRTYNSLGIQTRIDRDACGRVTYASGAYTAGDGSGRGTSTTYDWLGRVKEVSVTDPSGTPAKNTYTYSGTDVTVTDAIGRTTTSRHLTFSGPGDGRLASIVDPAGVTTSYQYDMLGHLTQVNGPGPGAAPRTWSYHPTTGRLQSDTQPESGTTAYTYDAVGNLKTVRDQAGRLTTYTYDNDERLTGRSTNNDSTSTLTIAYDLVGRVRQRTIPGVVTSYTFDNVGRMASRTDGIHPNMSFASNYYYDGNDNLTQIVYPCRDVACTQRRSVTYAYDVEDRLTTVRNDGALFAQNFTYDDAGRLASYQTGAVTHRFDYDIRDRVQRLRAGPASANALDLTYSYDKASQVMGIVDGRPGMYSMSQSFGYDALNRLTGAAGPWGLISWSYDSAGNRRTENRAGGSTVYNYDTASNRLISTTGNSVENFTYTAVGEVRTDSQATYDYSPTGMLLAANRSGMAASYLYDPDLLRVKRTVNNSTVVTVRGAAGQVLSELSSPCGGTPRWQRDNIYAGGKLLGAVRSPALPNTVEFVWPETGINENFGPFGMGVRLTTGDGQPLACAVTVSYEFVPGSATPNVDYTGTNGTLTFPAGFASGGYLGIGSASLDDVIDEDLEKYTVRLIGAVGAVLGATQQHDVLLYDQDPPPSITLSDASVSENNGWVWFRVNLSAPSAKPVTFRYSTQSATAVGGTDFVGRSDPITLPPGTTTELLVVQLVDDALAEPDETFYVSLSEVTNAEVGDGQAAITITDDLPRAPIDPSYPGQYFADIENTANEMGFILIYNPHTVPVSARLTFTRSDGTGLTDTISIPAQRRVDYALHVQGASVPGRFSVAVQSLDPARPLVSEHSGYSPTGSWTAGRNDGGSTPAPTWYFGEGAANSFFDETFTIFNPTNTPVRVTLSLIRPNAAPLVLTPLIPTGPGRVELRVNDWYPSLGDHGAIVSGAVEGTSTPANIAVQRTMRWPIGAFGESTTSSGTSTLTNNWYLGEGGKGGWSTFLSFMNPSATQQAEASVFYVHDNGQTYGQSVSIPPQRRVTMSPPPGMPDGGFAIHAGSANLVNYVVERSMYSGANFALGASSTATPTQATTWRFAEGASDTFFDTFFLVFNSNPTSTANVTLTFRKTNGTVATHVISLAPRTRGVVFADGVAGVSGSSYATDVVSTNGVPIVVERASYWPQGAWGGSHLSVGRPQ